MNWVDQYVEELVRQHEAELRRFTFSLVRNLPDTEELVQQAFMRLVYHLQDHPGKQLSEPRAYLYKILRNLYYDYLKNQKEEPEMISLSSMKRGGEEQTTEPLEIPDFFPANQPSIVAESNEGMNVITDEVDAIPNPGIRETMRLRLAGYSNMEVSEKLRQPIGTTKGYASKGYKYLRIRLSDLQDEGK